MANESADPLLALYGSGKDLWADEDADEYVRRIREGWDERTAWDHVEEEARSGTPPSAQVLRDLKVPQDDKAK